MKTLLTSLQERIANELDYLGGVKAVHLLPDEDLLPETTSFPCVGLKDGDIDHRELTNASRQFMNVDLIAFVSIAGSDAGIIGKNDDKGILDVMADLKDAVKDYEPTGYTAQHSLYSEKASKTMNFGGNGLVQKKKVTLRWDKA